jgi:hypothetical protein
MDRIGIEPYRLTGVQRLATSSGERPSGTFVNYVVLSAAID